jgi:hypothetical protein
MRRLTILILLGLSLFLALAPAAQAQATGVRCKSVWAGGYSATHVFVDFMPCRSARAKLRRWLPREQFPRKQNGWYCYRLSQLVRGCSYPGSRDADRGFTFWLRRISQSAARIRECGQLAHRHAYNITTRKVRCVEARRVVRRWNNTTAQEGGDGRVRGLYCIYSNIGYEAGDIRCTGSGGRVVRWQTYS